MNALKHVPERDERGTERQGGKKNEEKSHAR